MIAGYPINLDALDVLPTEQLRRLIEQLEHRLKLDEHTADCDSQLRELLLAVSDTGTARH